MPGVEIVGVFGDHAITIDEFMVVFEIYKKYENKGLFVFDKERFDYDRNARIIFKSENNERYNSTHPNTYKIFSKNPSFLECFLISVNNSVLQYKSKKFPNWRTTCST